MAKNITSKDPRKKQIILNFKLKFHCSKVTLVKENLNNFFGHCMRYRADKGIYESVGTQKISKFDLDENLEFKDEKC